MVGIEVMFEVGVRFGVRFGAIIMVRVGAKFMVSVWLGLG